MDKVLSKPINAKVYEIELASLPIQKIDVAQLGLFQMGLAPRYFERRRREAPVHCCTDGMFGSYWSISRSRDIEAIELDPATSRPTTSTAASRSPECRSPREPGESHRSHRETQALRPERRG